jgi:uncharacterized membrane protein
MMPAVFPFLAEFSLARPDSLFGVCGVALALGALVIWSYRPVRISGWRRALALGSKLCGFFLLLACWLEPQWLTRVPKQRANTVALLLDDSRSMRLPEDTQPNALSRGAILQEAWRRGAAGWRAVLDRDFRVRSFTFGSGLRELGPLSELAFNEGPTALGSALVQVRERVGEAPSAILAFTDGVPSDLAGLDASALPPVYPVLVGKPLSSPDLALGSVSSTLSLFEDAPATIHAEVRASHAGAPRIRVRIEAVDPLPAAGTKSILAETEVVVPEASGRAMAQLQFEPLRAGATFYRVSIDSAQIAASSEVTLENNTRLLCVNRTTGPHKILYVAGRPNWEFGPLRRALEGDPEVQLRALIRMAKREPKFTFKGRGGDATNPLFRGFQNGENAEVQRYDQPVLVRVNLDSPEELAGGFPKTAEELFGFKGIILANLEAEFFTPEQQRLLQRFVSERGGGLLMLGGMESFEGGGWRGTPMETLLPVWLGKDSAQPPGEFHWKLTREGLLEPWMRRRKTEAEETSRSAALPPLEVLNSVQGVKPAASVLALGQQGDGSRPAVAVQRFGLGRSGALLAGDLFHWGLGQPEHASDLAKFWRQMSRWLVADTPGPVDVSAQWNPATQATRLTVRVRDTEARLVEDAEVALIIRRIGADESASVRLRAEAAPEVGVYTVEYPSLQQGALVAQAEARTSAGVSLGSGSIGWVQDPSEAEFSALTANMVEMNQLANKTGGRVLALGELEAFVKQLKNAPNLATEVRIRPLWHTGFVFTLALVCLLVEWLVRRQNGAS